MDIRQRMVKERKDILDKMDDMTLIGQIDNYFDQNAAMPGEGQLKKEAIAMQKHIQAEKDNPDFAPDALLSAEDRDRIKQEFAEMCVKSTRLKNVHLMDGRTNADLPLDKGEDLGGGKTRYEWAGEAWNSSFTMTGSEEKQTLQMSFNNGTMMAEIPDNFAKAHPGIMGKNVTVEAVDYSNGHGKNVTYDMYVDLIKGNDFDRLLEQERFTPVMDADIMTRITDKFEAYVPGMGKAPTLGGEMVRAMNRIGYRYLNDGDKLNDGYGRETVNPAARFLMEKGSEDVKTALEEMWAPYTGDYFSDEQYEEMMNKLGEALMDQLDNSPELFTTPNEEDMFDYAVPNEDRDDSFDEEEEDYYEEEEEDEEDYDEEDYDDFADAVESLGSGIEMDM